MFIFPGTCYQGMFVCPGCHLHEAQAIRHHRGRIGTIPVRPSRCHKNNALVADLYKENTYV